MDTMSVCDDLFGHTYQMRGNGGPESVLSGHSKKTKNWFSSPIVAKCWSKVLQNAPGAFCNTFNIH